jgi:hypothetical protein
MIAGLIDIVKAVVQIAVNAVDKQQRHTAQKVNAGFSFDHLALSFAFSIKRISQKAKMVKKY